MKAIVIFICLCALAVSTTHGLSCVPCNPKESPCPRGELTNSDCPYGVTKDVCGCCDTCAKGPGESCGGPWGLEGTCGPPYTCVFDKTRPGLSFQATGRCA